MQTDSKTKFTVTTDAQIREILNDRIDVRAGIGDPMSEESRD